MDMTRLRISTCGRQTSWLIYKRSRGYREQHSWRSERDLHPGPTDFESTTLPHCLHLLIKHIECCCNSQLFLIIFLFLQWVMWLVLATVTCRISLLTATQRNLFTLIWVSNRNIGIIVFIKILKVTFLTTF